MRNYENYFENDGIHQFKIYDYSEKSLNDIPYIKEEQDFELKLNNNLITNFENIPNNCRILNISNNKISFISKRLPINLNLIFLDISFNRLISLNSFEKLNNLKQLNISNNFIADDQLLFIQNLNDLKFLNLSNNNLKTGTITNIIEKLKILEKLNISNNNLEFLEFDNLNENLIHLEIDSNKLYHIEFKSKFQNLIFLSLSNNKIEQINNTENIKNLEILDMNTNYIIKPEFVKKLKMLRILNIKNNLINKYKYEYENLQTIQSNKNIQNESFVLNMSSSNFSYLQSIELSYNNITEFSLEVDKNYLYFNSLKTILLHNNKLTDLNFHKNLNSLEFLDLGNNFLNKITFLQFCENLININLSFNKFENLFELVKIFKNFKVIREVNIIENEFNKGFYNLDVMNFDNNEFSFNCINDYFKINNNYERDLLDYRAYLIIKLQSIDKLDTIFISDFERKSVLEGISENKLFKLKSSRMISTKNEEIDKSVNNDINNKNEIKIIENQEIGEITKYNNNFNNKSLKESTKIVNVNVFNNNSNNFDTKIKHSFSNNNLNYKKVYNILKKSFTRICDKNGYMKYSDIKNLAEEIAKFYKINNQINELLEDCKNIIDYDNLNLFPGKLHFREFTEIIKKEKFSKMYSIIENKLIQKDDYNNEEEDIKIQLNSNNSKSINRNKNKTEIINTPIKNKNNFSKFNCNNTQSYRTPFLNSFKLFSKISNSSKIEKSHNKNKINNLLLQSQSQSNQTNLNFDFNDKSFLLNFLKYIITPPHPIKYSEYYSKLLIELNNTHKENILISNLISHFGIQNYKVTKFYSQFYYDKIFNKNNYDLSEFLLENSIFLFYGILDKIVINFLKIETNINNKSELNYNLILEESPLKLIEKYNIENFVIYMMIQKENCEVSFTYDNKNDNFIFSNPFENYNKNSKSQIIPIYIINLQN